MRRQQGDREKNFSATMENLIMIAEGDMIGTM